MERYSAFITAGDHGKIIHKYIIEVTEHAESEFVRTEIICVDPWPPSTVSTAIAGVKTINQAIEAAMNAIKANNELINSNQAIEGNDVYHGPFLISDDPGDQ